MTNDDDLAELAASDQATDAGEHDRWVFIERPRCPACDSISLQTIRSETQGDGSTKRRTLCRACSHRFFVVLE